MCAAATAPGAGRAARRSGLPPWSVGPLRQPQGAVGAVVEEGAVQPRDLFDARLDSEVPVLVLEAAPVRLEGIQADASCMRSLVGSR